MRLSPGWRRVLSAWTLVLVLILAGFGVKALMPSSDIAQASQGLSRPGLRGVRIPQFDPFDLGPSAFENAGSADDGDFDAEARFPN